MAKGYSTDLRMRTALYSAVHCSSFSGRSVSTGNLGSLFRDTFELARRPGADCLYFRQ